MNRDQENLIKVLAVALACFLWVMLFGFLIILTKGLIVNEFAGVIFLIVTLAWLAGFAPVMFITWNKIEDYFTNRYLKKHAKQKMYREHQESGEGTP